jgi:glycine cleavage system H protein
MIPEDRFYTTDHLWVKPDDGQLEIGVTRPLLHIVGELVAVELLDADDAMKEELPFGEIEGADKSHKLFPPTEARIIEVNSELLWNLEKLHEDPYQEGWLVRVEMEDEQQMDLLQLMTARLYEEYIQKNLGEEYLEYE